MPRKLNVNLFEQVNAQEGEAQYMHKAVCVVHANRHLELWGTSMMRPLGKPPPSAMSSVKAPDGMHSLQTDLISACFFTGAENTQNGLTWMQKQQECNSQFLRFCIAKLHDSASAKPGVEILECCLQDFCL